MIYKLGHVSDLGRFVGMDEHLKTAMNDYLSVLDTAYGCVRNIDEDDGGYVLYCTKGTQEDELKAHFNHKGMIPEWVHKINSEPPYTAILYIMSCDYVAVIVIADAEIPKDMLKKEN